MHASSHMYIHTLHAYIHDSCMPGKDTVRQTFMLVCLHTYMQTCIYLSIYIHTTHSYTCVSGNIHTDSCMPDTEIGTDTYTCLPTYKNTYIPSDRHSCWSANITNIHISLPESIHNFRFQCFWIFILPDFWNFCSSLISEIFQKCGNI